MCFLECLNAAIFVAVSLVDSKKLIKLLRFNYQGKIEKFHLVLWQKKQSFWFGQSVMVYKAK